MSEQDPGWKASVDGVVSDFDEVTRHLRRRQGQAVRVAWSVVGATALAMGALIGLDLGPSSGGTIALAPVVTSPPTPVHPGNLSTAPGLGPLALATADPSAWPSPAPAPSPTTPVTAAASSPRPHHHVLPVTAPVLASVPVSPPAALAPVASAPPAPSADASPPSSTPSGGIVDALVAGIVHGTP
jgi:hypothetical protein